MDHFDPHGDRDDDHGTTGRDVTLILICMILIGLVLSTFEQVPA